MAAAANASYSLDLANVTATSSSLHHKLSIFYMGMVWEGIIQVSARFNSGFSPGERQRDPTPAPPCLLQVVDIAPSELWAQDQTKVCTRRSCLKPFASPNFKIKFGYRRQPKTEQQIRLSGSQSQSHRPYPAVRDLSAHGKSM